MKEFKSKIKEIVVKELKKIISEKGFIDDSDGVYDTEEIAERLGVTYDFLIECLKENFNSIGRCKADGDYIGFYYSKDLSFEDDDLESFYKYFEIGE